MRFEFSLSFADWRRIKAARLEKWHRRFAWWPKCIGYAEWAWLEVVEARRVPHSNYMIGGYYWEYRAAHFQGLLP